MHLMPVSKRTLGLRGAKQIRGVSIDDKRQITVNVAGAATGLLLPLQLIFKGTTTRCLPRRPFLKMWQDKGWD